jgi:hypothetical protein
MGYISRKEINGLVSSLTRLGYLFFAVNYTVKKNNRKSKINFLLDDDSHIGETISPLLKNNRRLYLKFFSDKCVLHNNTDDLLVINDYIIDIEDTIGKIKTVYEEYFYKTDELDELFSLRKDSNKLKCIVNGMQSVPFRSYAVIEDVAYLTFGSGVASFVATTSESNTKLFMVETNVSAYGSKYTSYTSCHRLNTKDSLVVCYLNGVYYDFKLKRYVDAYEKLKEIKKELK